MIYKFKVIKDKIKPLGPMKGVTGNANYYQCLFEFDNDWDNLIKQVVFAGKKPVRREIEFSEETGYSCIVPDEVLGNVGEVFIGVYGYTLEGETHIKRISTDLISFDIVSGAYNEGAEEAKASAPSSWEVYEDKVLKYKAEAEAAKEGADLAKEEAKAIVSDPKLVKTEGNQEISGVKTFKNGIITNTISSEADDILAVNAGRVEITGDEYAEVYSPEGRIFIGTNESEILVRDTVDIRGAGVFINGKEIKDHLEKEDLQFDGNSITVGEVITSGVTIDGRTVEAEGGKLIYDSETIPFEKDVMHKSGDEEIEGVKSFKDEIKVSTIRGVNSSENEEWEEVNVDIIATTKIDGTGFIRLYADNDINIDTNFGSVYINGELPLAEGDIKYVIEDTSFGQLTTGSITTDSLYLHNGVEDDSSIKGTVYAESENEDGNINYVSAINIETDKLLYNDKEVAIKADTVNKTEAETIKGTKTFANGIKTDLIETTREWGGLNIKAYGGLDIDTKGLYMDIHTTNDYINIYNDQASVYLGYSDSDYYGLTLEATEGDVNVFTAGGFYVNDKEVATKEYVNNEIATFDFIKVVDELPAEGLPNRIYLVPKAEAQTQDFFDEYIWANGKWEWLTTKQIEVDLTGYVAKTAFSYDEETQTLSINI